jgi:hypothetical protein
VEAVADSQVLSLPSYSGLLDENWHLPFITRMEKQFGGKNQGSLKKFDKYFDKKSGLVTSETGELTYHTKAGVVTLNAGRVQGAFGFIGGRHFDFPALSFSILNKHAGVLAVSADGLVLTKAKKYYLVVTGPAKMTGQQYNASRTGLTNAGRLPVLAQVVKGKILLKSKKNKVTLTPLSVTGARRKSLKLKNHKAGQSFNTGHGRTLVYLVTRN